MPSSTSMAPAPVDQPVEERPRGKRELVWRRSAFAVALVVVLVALGVANIVLRARSHEVDDGVFWDVRPEGVTAVEVSAGGAGEAAGIEPGDVLIGLNGSPVQTRADVVAQYNRAHDGTRLTYQLLRLGSQQALDVSLAPVVRAGPMYFVLASVGLFTLLVGAAVRVLRPR